MFLSIKDIPPVVPSPFEIGKDTCVAVFSASATISQLLLHQIAGLEAFSQGEIWFNDQAISQIPLRTRRSRLKSRVGLLSESMGFLAGYNVADNLRHTLQFHLPVQKDDSNPLSVVASFTTSQTLAARSVELLARVHASEWIACVPSKLSESQRIRIGLAKALASTPELLLIDVLPPVIATESENEWRTLITDLMSLKTTVLFATALPRLAELAPQVLWLTNPK